MKIALIGNGSWATALAKIITDNGESIDWWMRNEDAVQHFHTKSHNKDYLSSVYFGNNINPTTDLLKVVSDNDIIIFCTPSAFIIEILQQLPNTALQNKICVSAIKGIILSENCLLNDYFSKHFGMPMENYIAITGPCHAEEVAQERLSYLTFSGLNDENVALIASLFKGSYINTTTNKDLWGTQYAAVLKNIYAMGAGIASGLGYGDNFLSVYVTNCYNEMNNFLITHNKEKDIPKDHNYITSAYLGDLLVTCYSVHSRNRTFGTLVGKGYFAKNVDSEMSMVAEGFYAIDGMYHIINQYNIDMPIVKLLYTILKEGSAVQDTFNIMEQHFQ